MVLRDVVYVDRLFKPYEVLIPGERFGRRYDRKGLYDLVDSNPCGFSFRFGVGVGDDLIREEIERASRRCCWEDKAIEF